MKLNNKQVRNIVTGIGRVTEDVRAGLLKPEVGTSFMLASLKKQLAPVYEAFDEENDKLLEEFVKKDDKGQKVKVPAHDGVPEQWDLGGRNDEWKVAMKELWLAETEFDSIKPIALDKFKFKRVKGEDGNMEDASIDPDILFLLSPWIILPNEVG